MFRLCLGLIIFTLGSTVGADEIRVLAWNVESDGNSPSEIVNQLREFEGYDIMLLSEVRPENVASYTEAIEHGEGADFRYQYSATGGSDRLAIVFDTNRFEQIGGRIDLHHHESMPLNFRNSTGRWRFRSPFIVKLRERATGLEFLVMANHLARGDAKAREDQSAGLREWAKDQALPVIAGGDYNFDYGITTGQGNSGYDAHMQDSAWDWIEPDPLIDTNWADRNGEDRYQDTVLDFIFVAGPAKRWEAASTVIVRQGDFPDNDNTSDHRPVEAVFTPSVSNAANDFTEEVLQRIQSIRAELDALEELMK